eukprot:Rhum_TRINITY_DN7741_c0_g1::Rhum_TRINITY_DN7741_c0_g1_i1::g.24319::m.24319
MCSAASAGFSFMPSRRMSSPVTCSALSVVKGSSTAGGATPLPPRIARSTAAGGVRNSVQCGMTTGPPAGSSDSSLRSPFGPPTTPRRWRKPRKPGKWYSRRSSKFGQYSVTAPWKRAPSVSPVRSMMLWMCSSVEKVLRRQRQHAAARVRVQHGERLRWEHRLVAHGERQVQAARVARRQHQRVERRDVRGVRRHLVEERRHREPARRAAQVGRHVVALRHAASLLEDVDGPRAQQRRRLDDVGLVAQLEEGTPHRLHQRLARLLARAPRVVLRQVHLTARLHLAQRRERKRRLEVVARRRRHDPQRLRRNRLQRPAAFRAQPVQQTLVCVVRRQHSAQRRRPLDAAPLHLRKHRIDALRVAQHREPAHAPPEQALCSRARGGVGVRGLLPRQRLDQACVAARDGERVEQAAARAVVDRRVAPAVDVPHQRCGVLAQVHCVDDALRRSVFRLADALLVLSGDVHDDTLEEARHAAVRPHHAKPVQAFEHLVRRRRRPRRRRPVRVGQRLAVPVAHLRLRQQHRVAGAVVPAHHVDAAVPEHSLTRLPFSGAVALEAAAAAVLGDLQDVAARQPLGARSLRAVAGDARAAKHRCEVRAPPPSSFSSPALHANEVQIL